MVVLEPTTQSRLFLVLGITLTNAHAHLLPQERHHPFCSQCEFSLLTSCCIRALLLQSGLQDTKRVWWPMRFDSRLYIRFLLCARLNWFFWSGQSNHNLQTGKYAFKTISFMKCAASFKKTPHAVFHESSIPFLYTNAHRKAETTFWHLYGMTTPGVI